MNLSISQSYLLCVLKDNGTISKLSLDDNWLIAAAMLDLFLNGIIENNDNKIAVVKELPQNLNYLKLLYEFFKSSNKNTKLSILEFSTRDFGKSKNLLFQSIAKSLEKIGAVNFMRKSNIFGEYDVFIPNSKHLNSIIEQIRTEILKDEIMSEKIIALSLLLDKTSHLRNYFSKHEKNELKKKIEKIKNSSLSCPVRDAIDTTITILCLFTVLLTID